MVVSKHGIRVQLLLLTNWSAKFVKRRYGGLTFIDPVWDTAEDDPLLPIIAQQQRFAVAGRPRLAIRTLCGQYFAKIETAYLPFLFAVWKADSLHPGDTFRIRNTEKRPNICNFAFRNFHSLL